MQMLKSTDSDTFLVNDEEGFAHVFAGVAFEELFRKPDLEARVVTWPLTRCTPFPSCSSSFGNTKDDDSPLISVNPRRPLNVDFDRHARRQSFEWRN